MSDDLPHEVDVDLQAAELRGRIVGDTLTVTIDRPGKRNSVTADGYHGIKRAAMIVADEPRLQFLVIVPHADLASETQALLDRVRGTGPIARAAMKAEMARALPEVDVAGYWSTIGTAEQIEAWAAFMEKRPPKWPSGRPDRDGFAATRRAQWMHPES